MSVLVFIIYILGFIFLNAYRFLPKKTGYIEIVKITQNANADTWTVHLKAESKEAELEATVRIKDGKVLGGVMGWKIREVQR